MNPHMRRMLLIIWLSISMLFFFTTTADDGGVWSPVNIMKGASSVSLVNALYFLIKQAVRDSFADRKITA